MALESRGVDDIAIIDLDGQKGVTLVESVFALPFLIILLIISFEILKVSYYQLTLQFSLTRVARDHSVDPTLDVRASLNSILTPLGVGLTSNDKLTVCPRLGDCYPNVVNSGSPRDPMLFRVERQVNVLFLPAKETFGSGLKSTGFNLTAIVLGRNEPL